MTRIIPTVYGIDITVEEFGDGSPVLLLASEEGPAASRELAGRLASDHRVLIPHHPGYGDSPALPWRASVRDLAYVHSEILDSQGLSGIPVIGSGIGGWAALELAAMGGGQVSSLTLLGPVGIKLTGIEERDFADIHAISVDERARRGYHDPELGRLDTDQLSLEEIEQAMCWRETFTNYVWEPYLHAKELRFHVARVRVPTLVISGDSDRLVRPRYHADLAEFLPNARHIELPACGHFPDLERPFEVADQFNTFIARNAAASV